MLLVPGFTGSKEDFLPLLPLVAEAGHPVWAIDLRGQYESTGPDDEAAYRIDALAADVAVMLTEIAGAGGRAHLLGHSFGGLVCRRALLAHPGSDTAPLMGSLRGVSSYTLLGSGPGGIPSPSADNLHFLRPILEQGGIAAVWDAVDQLTNDPAAAAAPADVQEFLRRRFLANNPVALATMADDLLGEPDATDALRETGLPLLVAHGAADDAWPPAVQKDMAARLGADYVEIPDSIHSPAVENPQRTAEVLTAFWCRAEAASEAAAEAAGATGAR